MLEININKFYKIGVVCFGIIAVMNLVTFYLNLSNGRLLYPSMVFSTIFQIIFNFALFGFFYYLYSNLPPTDLPRAKKTDMEDLLRNGK